MKTLTLAGGCFWCLDAVYRHIDGVVNVVSGYTGGDLPAPTYDQVSMGATGHAEAVQITFDDKKISPDVILDLYFLIHDPTTKDRQGNDIGTQYRSAMFYENEQQKQQFKHAIERAKEHWDDSIVTQLSELGMFYPAEEYHQDYFNKNPGNGYCTVVIEPKIAKARQKFRKYFKEQ